MSESKLPPPDNQVTFLLTFDFDAETIWKQRAKLSGHPGGVTYESSGTFGPKVGIWRILSLLKSYDILATFFVPGWVAERWPRCIEAILAHGHEIALHSYLHERMGSIVAREEEAMILAAGIRALTAVAGAPPAGYRPPEYVYTNWTLDLMREFGLRYGSAMQDDDQLYVHPGQGSRIVEVPIKWWLTDDLFGWPPDVHLPSSLVEEHWLSELREIRRYPDRVFVPTLHPQVIGHAGRLPLLERMLQLGLDSRMRFRRCVDVADQLLSRK